MDGGQDHGESPSPTPRPLSTPDTVFLLSAPSAGTLAQGRGLLTAMGVEDRAVLRVCSRSESYSLPYLAEVGGKGGGGGGERRGRVC